MAAGPKRMRMPRRLCCSAFREGAGSRRFAATEKRHDAGGPLTLRRKQDVWIALALFAAGWGIRLALASRLEFPPLDDPAFYVQTARNLAAGRGLVSDVLWSYQFAFPAVTHPSHEYWMPSATLLMAPWIKAFGDSLLIAQLPGTLCGALLV